MSDRRQWEVLLIGGASGVGKTHVSYRLAQHFGVGITEIDDFQVVLERMTTPEQQPVLHFFRKAALHRLDDEETLALMIRYAGVMAEPLEYVIANHLASGPPVVLEGDFLLPSLAGRPAYDGVPAAGRVRALFATRTTRNRSGATTSRGRGNRNRGGRGRAGATASGCVGRPDASAS